MNSGYVMVDGTGLDLNELGTVTGLYAKVKKAIETGKPILLENVVNGSIKFTPIHCYGAVESASSVILGFYPISIHINSSDVVSM